MSKQANSLSCKGCRSVWQVRDVYDDSRKEIEYRVIQKLVLLECPLCSDLIVKPLGKAEVES